MTPAIADSLSGRYFENRMDQEKNLQVYYEFFSFRYGFFPYESA
jgi:hypothetical protein